MAMYTNSMATFWEKVVANVRARALGRVLRKNVLQDLAALLFPGTKRIQELLSGHNSWGNVVTYQ